MAKATLAINIISDASGAQRGFNDTTSALDKFKSGLDRASVASAAALGGMALLGKSAFDAASDFQQSSGAIETVFGKYAAAEKSVAQHAAKTVGLSANSYQELAAVIGSQLKNAGMSMEEVTGRTEALIEKGADMAAVFGGTAGDAVEALSSALKGEMDPLERYGVSLNQSAINAQKAADGNANLTGAADKAAQTQAILELITAQTAQTTGQWAAQAGTAAEQTQTAGANAENAGAKIGETLLPVVGWLADKLSQVADWMGKNKTTTLIFAGVLGGMAATILIVKGAVEAWQTAVKVATALQWIWNFAMDANPIGLVVLGIAAVIAIVILMYNKFQWFRDLVAKIGQFFKAVWDDIVRQIHNVGDFISNLGDVFSRIFAWIDKVMQPVTNTLKWIADKISWVISAAKKVGGFIGGLFGAPAPAPVAGGGARALFGAAPGMRAAGLLTAGGGGTSPAATSGALGATTVNVTVNGALDPVAVGKQISNVLRDYSRRTGRQVAVQL
jgi:hypothetical protein